MIDPIQLLQFFLGFSIVYGFAVLIFSGSGFKKNQLGAGARYANRWEILNAFRTAKKQLSRPRVDAYCLHIGSFDRSILKGIKGLLAELLVFATKKLPALFIPYANTCIEILGKAGTGKTFLLNLILASSIEAHRPLGLYDNKAGSDGRDGQISFVAPYAKAHGFQLGIIAPGRDYSNAIVNLVQQVIKTPTDMTGARTMARGLHRCLRAMHGKTDGFFGPAGERLLAGSFLLAKNTDYPDIATAFAILTLPDLTSRLAYAISLPDHPFVGLWQQIGFKQLVSVESAPKTASNIIAGASDVILDLIQEDLLSSFIGDSNTDLYIKGKQLLVFVGDDSREDVIAPFLSTYMSCFIALNCSDYRDEGIVLSVDEAEAVGHFDGLPKHSNRYRSKGLCTILSYQTLNQLYKWYGKEGTREARASIGNRIWLNPGDPETAAEMSKYLGKQEVIVKSQTQTQSSSTGSSTTTSEQVREVPLKRPEEFTLDGRSVFTYINAAFASGSKAHRPIQVEGFKASPQDVKKQEIYKIAWFDQILPQLQREHQAQKKDLGAELIARIKYVEQLLPLPPTSDDSGRLSSENTIDSSNSTDSNDDGENNSNLVSQAIDSSDDLDFIP
ncbi:MAG: type IV secretion system DNA-binding domain-containing protein [Prochloraceae cyanobacterium]|nr:type IV secretion system DNA-binding domain-containing protein [Prochloraceae cyanobacterium]